MIVEFEEKYLRELFATGKTKDKQHRFQPDVIKRYTRCIQTLFSIDRLEDLYIYNSLHYEVLKGDMKDIHSIRVNDKYRVLFNVKTIDGKEITTICSIIELSKHYQ